MVDIQEPTCGPARPDLLHGSLETFTAFMRNRHYQPPNLWWPEDRRWCVATEIDFMSTYVGCDQDCAAKLLAHSALEALLVPSDARGAALRDDVNPTPMA